jgi:hypothetical protein
MRISEFAPGHLLHIESEIDLVVSVERIAAGESGHDRSQIWFLKNNKLRCLVLWDHTPVYPKYIIDSNNEEQIALNYHNRIR